MVSQKESFFGVIGLLNEAFAAILDLPTDVRSRMVISTTSLNIPINASVLNREYLALAGG